MTPAEIRAYKRELKRQQQNERMRLRRAAARKAKHQLEVKRRGDIRRNRRWRAKVKLIRQTALQPTCFI